MSQTMRLWVETSFNIFYLIAVWWIVLAMWQRRSLVAESDRRTANLMMLAFFFLGFGDIGHVGFRLVAFALGGLETSVTVFGEQLKLAPMGALATAITFTFFYVAMMMIWKARFNKTYGAIAYIVFALAVVRLLIMTHPANGWNSTQVQYTWSIYRNVPLMLMQLGVAYLIMRDAIALHDRIFIRVSALILVSFACYAPVIFLQQRAPLIAMLMIPKTIAYLAIAIIGLRALFPKRAVPGITASSA
jgi:hypothetical protein